MKNADHKCAILYLFHMYDVVVASSLSLKSRVRLESIPVINVFFLPSLFPFHCRLGGRERNGMREGGKEGG